MNKNGFSIIYLIFLIGVVLWLWVIVVNKQNFLFALSQRSEIQSSFLKEITAKYQSVLNSFSLDPVLTQKSLFWFIPNNGEYYNTFWYSKNARDFFSWAVVVETENYKKISDISSFYLDIDVEDAFDLKIIQWDKGYYNLSSQLLPLTTQEFSYENWQVWLLQNDGTISSSTWWLLLFDTQNDYSFFIKTWSWVVWDYMRYELRAFENETSSWVVINPIYQENSKIFYLWYDIKKIENNYLFKILNF